MSYVRRWTEILNITVCMFQGMCEAAKEIPQAAFRIIISGSKIPKWFNNQSVGSTLNAQVSHPNKWMGMLVGAVFSFHDHNPKENGSFRVCTLSFNNIGVNKHKGVVGQIAFFENNFVHIEVLHLWVLYFPFHCFDENLRAVLSQIDENEVIHLEVTFENPPQEPCLDCKECGIHILYEQDIEYIGEMIGQCSNSITP